jgi:hypothetical protein
MPHVEVMGAEEGSVLIYASGHVADEADSHRENIPLIASFTTPRAIVLQRVASRRVGCVSLVATI